MFDMGLMMKLGGMWMKFTKNHPKFPQFMNSVKSNGLKVDTVIDVKITYPDGKVAETNLKVTQSDLDMMEELKKIKK